MSNWRRIAIGYTAMTMTLLTSANAVGANQPAQTDDPPPVTVAEPIVPGGEAVEIVHSWALAPTGSPNPTEAGNRPILAYEADPGSVIEDSVTLYNFGNEQLTFRVYATDAFNEPDGQINFLPGDDAPTDVGSWIALPQEYITVAPGAQATMPITITIPDDARPGDHAGAVLAANDTQSTGPDGDTVKLDRRIGTRVLMRVNGPLNPELSIEDLNTSYRPALNPLGGSATVSYTIANTGNVRLSGSSVASIAGPFGLGEVDGVPGDFPELLPGGSIALTAEFEDVPALGIARTTIEVTPLGEEADVATVTRSSRTLAIPIAVVLGLIAFVFALVGLRAYRKHRSKGEPPTDLGAGTQIEYESLPT